MRNLLFLSMTALLAACGGGGASSSGPVGGDGDTTPDPAPAALPPGSSGFPGLDWGDSIAAVQADYPAAVASGDELQLQTAHGGRDAAVSFMFTGGSLIAIDVTYPGTFESMEACGAAFAEVRGALDQSLGQSSEDNLAAYWSSASASATLVCNPDESGTATMGLSYSLPEDLE